MANIITSNTRNTESYKKGLKEEVTNISNDKLIKLSNLFSFNKPMLEHLEKNMIVDIEKELLDSK